MHSTAIPRRCTVRFADERVYRAAPRPGHYLNIPDLCAAITGADAIHPDTVFSPRVRIRGDGRRARADLHRSLPATSADGRSPRKPPWPAWASAIPGLRLARGTDLKGRGLSQPHDPVLIKAAAGGRGRGMKIGARCLGIRRRVPVARTEARAAFGNDGVYLEKYLDRPRHIELQILADEHGNVVHFGERDCRCSGGTRSCSRRRARPRSAGRSATRSVDRDGGTARLGYRNAGTLEFLYQDGQFAFIEMNTRLQVEHPVTEMVCSVDLVREQIRIAAGQRLGYGQPDISFRGHAIECRITAEDPTVRADAWQGNGVPHARGPGRACQFGAVFRLQGAAVLRQHDRETDSARTIAKAAIDRMRRVFDEFAVDTPHFLVASPDRR